MGPTRPGYWSIHVTSEPLEPGETFTGLQRETCRSTAARRVTTCDERRVEGRRWIRAERATTPLFEQYVPELIEIVWVTTAVGRKYTIDASIAQDAQEGENRRRFDAVFRSVRFFPTRRAGRG